jgi:hypothetical protein
LGEIATYIVLYFYFYIVLADVRVLRDLLVLANVVPLGLEYPVLPYVYSYVKLFSQYNKKHNFMHGFWPKGNLPRQVPGVSNVSKRVFDAGSLKFIHMARIETGCGL